MTDEPSDTDSEAPTADPGRPSVFGDIEAGDTGVTQGRTITEADVRNFAGVSGDFNHIHTDEERMSESVFGEPIAHGMLVVSAATGLLWQTRSPEEREAVVAFYGIDELRFSQPVYVGDTIHVETEVLEKHRQESGPGTGVVRFGVEVKTQRDQVVVSMELLSLMN